jgi:hypothetical protein
MRGNEKKRKQTEIWKNEDREKQIRKAGRKGGGKNEKTKDRSTREEKMEKKDRKGSLIDTEKQEG